MKRKRLDERSHLETPSTSREAFDPIFDNDLLYSTFVWKLKLELWIALPEKTLTNFLLPKMEELNFVGMWFQQDGATCHTARDSMAILRENSRRTIHLKKWTGMLATKIMRFDAFRLFYVGLRQV